MWHHQTITKKKSRKLVELLTSAGTFRSTKRELNLNPDTYLNNEVLSLESTQTFEYVQVCYTFNMCLLVCVHSSVYVLCTLTQFVKLMVYRRCGTEEIDWLTRSTANQDAEHNVLGGKKQKTNVHICTTENICETDRPGKSEPPSSGYGYLNEPWCFMFIPTMLILKDLIVSL